MSVREPRSPSSLQSLCPSPVLPSLSILPPPPPENSFLHPSFSSRESFPSCIPQCFPLPNAPTALPWAPSNHLFLPWVFWGTLT